MTYEVQQTASRIIGSLYRDGNPDKAILAGLRNAPTITSRRAQGAWPLIMENLDKKYLSHDKYGTPTAAEVAVYTAIRFYAIHQQGKEMCMYAPTAGDNPEGSTLFDALAILRKNEEKQVALDRRVQPILATASLTKVINDIAHLISIIKDGEKTIKIDYAWLAQDLYGLQGNYEQANRVRLHWGEQYYRVKSDAQIEGDNAND